MASRGEGGDVAAQNVNGHGAPHRVQVRAALFFRLARERLFIDRDKMTLLDRYAPLNDRVIDRTAHADGSEHALGIEARADQLKPARVDEEEVAAFADRKRAGWSSLRPRMAALPRVAILRSL